MHSASYIRKFSSGFHRGLSTLSDTEGQAPTEDEALTSRALTFLLVDDKPSTRKYIKYCLIEYYQNAHILEAENGEEAYSILRVIKPSILIMDLNIPVMSGYTLLSKLRKNFSGWQVPLLIINCTGQHPAMNEDVRLLKKWETLKKPFSQEVLISRVQGLLTGNL